MTDLTEELRIIAQDGGKLSKSDRALIARAADEIESGWSTVRRIEARISKLEQELDYWRRPSPEPIKDQWSMSTGWCICAGYETARVLK